MHIKTLDAKPSDPKYLWEHADGGVTFVSGPGLARLIANEHENRVNETLEPGDETTRIYAIHPRVDGGAGYAFSPMHVEYGKTCEDCDTRIHQMVRIVDPLGHTVATATASWPRIEP